MPIDYCCHNRPMPVGWGQSNIPPTLMRCFGISLFRNNPLQKLTFFLRNPEQKYHFCSLPLRKYGNVICPNQKKKYIQSTDSSSKESVFTIPLILNDVILPIFLQKFICGIFSLQKLVFFFITILFRKTSLLKC